MKKYLQAWQHNVNIQNISITQQLSTCLKMVNFMFHMNFMFHNDFNAKSKNLGSSFKSTILYVREYYFQVCDLCLHCICLIL